MQARRRFALPLPARGGEVKRGNAFSRRGRARGVYSHHCEEQWRRSNPAGQCRPVSLSCLTCPLHWIASLPLAMTTKEKREAERRQTCVQPPRPCGHGAHPFSFPLPRLRGRVGRGHARLSAFHRGSCVSERTPTLSSRPGFLGRGRTLDPVRSLQPGSEDLALLNGRYPRPPVPVQGTHLPDRS